VAYVSAALLFSAQGVAQPQNSLPTLVALLQQTPQDDALRTEVIRLGREAVPPPAIPPESLRHAGAGQGYFKGAVSPQTFRQAAREYEQALRLAPWVASLYFGAAEAYENMSDAALAAVASSATAASSCTLEVQERERQRFDGYEQARRYFEFYLLARPDLAEQEVAMIRRRIAERALSFERWRYEWNATCCLGCGGKQDPVR
jgi:hypothetical protein